MRDERYHRYDYQHERLQEAVAQDAALLLLPAEQGVQPEGEETPQELEATQENAVETKWPMMAQISN
jgi:hypothetical protein